MMDVLEDDILASALVEKSLISRAQLDQVRSEIDPSQFDTSLVGHLLLKRLVHENDLADLIAQTFTVPRMTIASETLNTPKEVFPPELSSRFCLLPVFEIGKELTVAMVGPPYAMLLEALGRKLDRVIIPVVTTLSDFDEALRNHEFLNTSLSEIEERIDLAQAESLLRDNTGLSPKDIQERIPSLYELSDVILWKAAKQGASDIHLEPQEDCFRVRYRMDGVLHEMARFSRDLSGPLVAVVKNRSGMDMFERSATQDGRIDISFGETHFDIRTSTVPTINGEKLVMRILRKEDVSLSLHELGFSDENLEIFTRFIRQPNGIILVTGPTGCGKTTTLYAALRELNRDDVNIVTIENPVEYRLPSISQIQVHTERDITFAGSLRAILRQDPDIILVGEIRDVETGRVATEAALTGHLVLSTLHTNDAIGAIPRLLNMGIPPVWLGPSLIGIVAQRLVRRICPQCIAEHKPHADVLHDFALPLENPFVFFHGQGCEACRGEGYKGRTAIHEILVVTEEIREQVLGETSSGKIRHIARRQKFQTMQLDGLKKALDGITTLEEVRRWTRSL